MGKLVLPKHSSDKDDFITALKIYYEHETWVENATFVSELKGIIGDGQYPSSYNKKAQLLKYFGFVTVGTHSKQKITALGKMLYEAIEGNNQHKINTVFMIAFENIKFGRNNMGSPSSDSDVEMPNVALHAINDLQKISYKELAWILTEVDNGKPYDDVINYIRDKREHESLDFDDPNRYADNKPIMLLVNLGVLEIDEKYSTGRIKYLRLSDLFSNQFKNSINDLPIYNTKFQSLDKNTILADLENEIVRVKEGENVLFYGVPGSGKSYTIEDEYGSERMTRVVFHPDYMSTDFIGQILPTVKQEEGSDEKIITYEFTPGPFTNVMERAYKDPGNMYYLVIEEINRGNAPAIFGEIFQLLDRDENGTSKYAVVNYPVARAMYGDEQKPIRIPSNLTILATMNTSDQNVFTLDTAFQRRWTMRMIINDIEKAEHKEIKICDTQVTWKIFNEVINDRILNSNATLLSSEDKRLGAYFVTKSDLEKEKDSEKRFSEKVIKYLWDDAFKFSRDKIFESSFRSLEQVIQYFISQKGNDRFNIFNSNVRTLIFDRVTSDKEMLKNEVNLANSSEIEENLDE